MSSLINHDYVHELAHSVFGKRGMRAQEYPIIWTPPTFMVCVSLFQTAEVDLELWEPSPLKQRSFHYSKGKEIK